MIDVKIFAVVFVYLSTVIAMIITIVILHECIYKYIHIPIRMNSTSPFLPERFPKIQHIFTSTPLVLPGPRDLNLASGPWKMSQMMDS